MHHPSHDATGGAFSFCHVSPPPLSPHLYHHHLLSPPSPITPYHSSPMSDQPPLCPRFPAHPLAMTPLRTAQRLETSPPLPLLLPWLLPPPITPTTTLSTQPSVDDPQRIPLVLPIDGTHITQFIICHRFALSAQIIGKRLQSYVLMCGD